MPNDPFRGRLGLSVPNEWWPAASLLKGFEAAGFRWTQFPAPPASVLCNPRDCLTHAAGVRSALEGTSLDMVLHGPGELVAGTRGTDRAFEGLLAYAAEAGARAIVYHGRNFPDGSKGEDFLLAETRSLFRLAAAAERLDLTIAVENLAPVFPGPERIGHTPMALRTLCKRISSPALGLCLDLGHAHVVADRRHTDVGDLVEPVLDSVVLFHLHDNLGARRSPPARPDLDPLRLDLHLAPGAGTLCWAAVASSLRRTPVPIILEVHPPHRPNPRELFEQTLSLLSTPTPLVAA
jgi:sugar phosphate isomerase/epimerase